MGIRPITQGYTGMYNQQYVPYVALDCVGCWGLLRNILYTYGDAVSAVSVFVASFKWVKWGCYFRYTYFSNLFMRAK